MNSKLKYFFLIVILSLLGSVKENKANGNEEPFKISFRENRQSIFHKEIKPIFGLKSNVVSSLFDTNKNMAKKKSLLPSTQKTTLHPVRLVLIGTGMTIAWLGLHIYYTNTWWKDKVHYFKFAEDPWYARNVDKVSHVYTAAVVTEGTGTLYEWAGIKPLNAIIYGGVTAMAYETYIEMFDGISPIWGFDWGDMAGNLIGSLYPIAQKLAPVLNNFNLKWSFQPEWIKRKTGNTQDLLNDYTSMTFWLSINPKGLLPKKIAQYYPGFLAVALGVRLQGASHEGTNLSVYRELYLALDYDLTKLPGDTEFLKKLKKILNYYHFPSPAVRISPSGIWYGIYF